MRIISFMLILFSWMNPLMSGVDVNIGPNPSNGYYYEDDEDLYWYGPGYYNGIWFDDEDNWHRHHGHRGYYNDSRSRRDRERHSDRHHH